MEANANVPAAQEAPTSTAPTTETVENAATTDPAEAANGATTTDPNAGSLGFAPDIEKFLKNQNIDVSDPKAAIETLARRNMKLRGHQSEQKPEGTAKQQNQEAARVLNGDDSAKETQPQAFPQTGNSAPAGQGVANQTTPTHKGAISELEVATIAMLVQQRFPDVKADADFYKSMVADGFSPAKNGSANLNSILNYASYKQKLADAEKAIKNAHPDPNNLPSPASEQYADVNKVDQMTKTAAENIVMFSNRERRAGRPVHPQLEEATRFLQDMHRK